MERFARKLWRLFEEDLFPRPSTESLFNQYRDIDPQVDRPDAALIRRANLKNYLASFPAPPVILAVGEAAGPWELRFSGVPFTGERQLISGALPFSGDRSSRDELVVRLYRRPPFTSNSSQVFWKVMARHHPKFLVWDAAPLHPHQPGKNLSVRSLSRAEVSEFSGLLGDVVRILKPKHFIAIGRKAEQALAMIGMPSYYAHHPSHGQADLFQNDIARFFRALRGVRP